MKRLKFHRAIVAIAMMLIGWLPSLAHDFEVDGIFYNKTSDNTAAVTYKGDSYNSYSNEYIGDVVIPSSVKYNGVTYSVTSIGYAAFAYCSSLTDVVIGNSVTSIGDAAFAYCSSLTDVVIGNSVTSIGDFAFRNCSSLTSIEIPNSVTSIGDDAFYSCESLTSIEIPNSVTSIGDGAFSFCTSLTSIEIPNSVTSIGYGAFVNCTNLTSIEIPNSVTSIGDDAFNGCSSLTSIEIPNSVTSIGDYAFSYCSSLTSIVVDSGNSKYDSRNGCNAIIETASNTLIAGCQNTIIPNSVTSIGAGAFCGCTSLTGIEIPNSVISIGDNAFTSCKGLTSIEIPNSVTSIGYRAFLLCSGLTSIVVDSGNTKYDSRNGCNAIIETASNTLIAGCQNTIIPNSVTSIGDHAFSNCSSLTSIEIPNSVTSIGDNAFYGCTSLTEIICHATTPPTIESYTFSNYDANLYVPAGCKAVYEAAEYWNNFTNIIELEPVLAEGATFEYEGLTYKVIVKGEELAVIASENGKYSGDIVIPSSVNYNGTTYSVTSIGDFAFNGCTNLTSIEIPNSVISIEDWAFEGCPSLTSIEIPNSVTGIGINAFSNCSSLTSIVVDSGNTKYDSRNDCNAIIETASNTLIAGCQNTIIPNSVTSIGNYAFRLCSSLTSIEIPNSVTSIGDGAFTLCKSLTSIEIPNSVTSIGYSAFSDCESLTSVVVDSGNTKYDSRNGCNAIIKTASNTLIAGCQNTIIPNSVTSIGDNAFYGCTSLTSIEIPNSVTSIGEMAFFWCSSLTSIEIPNSVTSIGFAVFCWCESLTSIVVDSGNTKYDSQNGCNAIIETASNTLIAGCQNTIIPNSVTSIGEMAFLGCSGLTSIQIPNSVTNIGDAVFYGCSSLTEIKCWATTPPTIYSNTFSNYSADLYVPVGCKSAYQSANYWKNFNIINDTLDNPVTLNDNDAIVATIGDNIVVKNATAGSVVRVYAVDGAMIATGVATDGDVIIEAPVKGVYVVKVGKQTVKVII